MALDICPENTFGAGRNVTIFDELRRAAYKQVRQFFKNNEPFGIWRSHCEEVAGEHNLQFPNPLNYSEIRSIARSVARWTCGATFRRNSSAFVSLVCANAGWLRVGEITKRLKKPGHGRRWGSAERPTIGDESR